MIDRFPAEMPDGNARTIHAKLRLARYKIRYYSIRVVEENTHSVISWGLERHFELDHAHDMECFLMVVFLGTEKVAY